MNKILSVSIAALLAAAAVQAAPAHRVPAAAQTAQAQTQTERNKANALAFYALAFYELAFNRHKVQEAAVRYIGKTYLQHNPTVADGAQAFVDAFTPFLKENPQSRAEIKRVVAEGDLVVLHVLSRTSPQDKGEAVVDIFRFDENGKIVEHWDVIQPVPEKSVSGRGMF